jgi:hypothetical protein
MPARTRVFLDALAAEFSAPKCKQVEAAVRRDHIRLSRSDSDDGAPRVNAVTGRVAAIEYQGTPVLELKP